MLARAILRQVTKSSGKDYPVSPISNSVSSLELNLWVIERFVERIRCVNVDAVSCDDVIVLQPDATDLLIARIGLEIERNPFLQHDRRILR